MFATIVMTMFFISFMFLVIMFIVYFDYILSDEDFTPSDVPADSPTIMQGPMTRA